ncbi:ribonuclease hi [Plakobranchus ocellatus]|uniref:Ribonuclease hi n=1 Tax=Plakobranchus ocellatus TaxID=259542 RepID=A0AAV4BNG3_9GAST|nr:ribonuclease hi [Plakobranchus ocellatus]
MVISKKSSNIKCNIVSKDEIQKHVLRALDSIHHQGLRIALGVFRTSPFKGLYAEAESPGLYTSPEPSYCPLGFQNVAILKACMLRLRAMDSIHHQSLRIALGAFRTSPIKGLYAEAGEPWTLYIIRAFVLPTGLSERRLLKACTLRLESLLSNIGEPS